VRTTLDLDDTVLAAARSLARSRRISLGDAVSELARRGLLAPVAEVGSTSSVVDLSYSPFPVMVGDTEVIVTDELVAALRDG
jgi:hypothetical protein